MPDSQLTPLQKGITPQELNSFEELDQSLSQLSEAMKSLKVTPPEKEDKNTAPTSGPRQNNASHAWSQVGTVGITPGSSATLYFHITYSANFIYDLHPTYHSIKVIKSISDVTSYAATQTASASSTFGSYTFTFNYNNGGSVGAIGGQEQIGYLSYNGTGVLTTVYKLLGGLYSTESTSQNAISYNTQVYSSTFPNVFP